MKLGLTMPILKNHIGAIEAVNSCVSEEHSIRFFLVNNAVRHLSVAASWNFACERLFEDGCEAVLITNDDILAHPQTIDHLVAYWQETGHAMVSAVNVRDQMSVAEMMASEVVPPYEDAPHPDYSFFLLPRETWDVVGRFDENFFPGYFEDGDHHARIVLSGLHAYATTSAPYYHYGSGTQNFDQNPVVNSNQFLQNSAFFAEKWGNPTVNDEEEMRMVYHQHPFADELIPLSATPRLRY